MMLTTLRRGGVTVSGTTTTTAAVTGPADVTLTVTDDDPTAVTLARAGGSVVYVGSSVAYTVTLGRALAAGETVTALLSFASGEWDRDARLRLHFGGHRGVWCGLHESGFGGGVGEVHRPVGCCCDAHAERAVTAGGTVDINLGALTASTAVNAAGGVSGSDNAAVLTISGSRRGCRRVRRVDEGGRNFRV